MKEDKILKKVGKLLTIYGVSDEEKEKFLLDLKDKKYDDQEEVEETVEEEEPNPNVAEEEETPTSEEPSEDEGEVEEEVSEEAEEVDGAGSTEEAAAEEEEPQAEAPSEEENPMEEETPQEPNPMEAPQEQPMEEAPVEEQPQQEQNHDEEYQKALDGALARIAALEDIITKMGVPLQGGEEIGVAPSNPGGEGQVETEFNRFNEMRMGRK